MRALFHYRRWILQIKHFDLIIVGAGIVGTSLALAAAKARVHSPFRVAVIEAGKPPKAHLNTKGFGVNDYDARVNTLNLSSVSLLRRLGVWQRLPLERCCPMRCMHVWDDSGTTTINFDAAHIDAQSLAYTVESGVLRYHLNAALLEHADCTQIFYQRFPSHLASDADGVRLVLDDGTVLNSTYLFAVDGAHSKTRAMAGFRWFEQDCAQIALVSTVEHARSHENHACQRFLDSGPLAFLPLRGPNPKQGKDSQLSSIVWSLDNEVAPEILSLNASEFRARLESAIEHRLGALSACSVPQNFPLRYGTASAYMRGRVFLVGDAAHTVHPMAGMGVNLGLGDVAMLMRALKDFDGVHLSSRAYRARRYIHNTATVFGLEGLRRVYASRTASMRWLRNIGSAHIANSKTLRRLLMLRAS